MERIITRSNDPTALPDSVMSKRFFVGRSPRTGTVHCIDMERRSTLDLTPDDMANLTCTVQVSGLTNNGEFFVGIKGEQITKPHVSLSLKGGRIYLQGSMADTSEEAMVLFIRQMQ
jgi:hypothetical protein